ncbi:MAG: methionyl-tRNA formyltransferase [Gloeomargaritaceae cyanobacterium C42_A2020_066]|nr:methionyl-tRNA formyltransferase [Gloeomargaritaceae cyanobacterium C42_A2020_066]
MPLKVVFFGTPRYALPSLDCLLADPEVQVLGVVTQPDRRRGRGAQRMPSPVKARALEVGLTVWEPERLRRSEETQQALGVLGADAFVVVAYGQLLPPAVLAMPRLGCFNGHASLLPAYRGAAPIQWCLYHGETETGVTTMLMEAGLDTGPILLMGRQSIALEMTAPELADTLAHLTAGLLRETLASAVRGTLVPIPQNDALATYAPLIQKSDYSLDWGRPAEALHNQVRAFYPASQTFWRDQTLKVVATLPLVPTLQVQMSPTWQSRLASYWPQVADLATATPGTVVSCWRGLGPVVQTGQGVLLIHQLQLPGRPVVSGADWLNSAQLHVGERLG